MVSRRSFLGGAAATLLYPLSARAGHLSFDIVVYGATSGGIAAAFEAKRQGRSVALVGGWRESHLGGMMSGGLGYSDVDSPRAYGGLARYVIDRINERAGHPPGTFAFQPRFAEAVFQDLLARHDIPVFWSLGVTRVRKENGLIVEIATTMGQTFAAKVFIDASYEGDLADKAGVTTFIGREAASPQDLYNGYRNVFNDGGGSNHNFVRPRFFLKFLADRHIYLDPFVTPSDPASGLLPGVRERPQLPSASGDGAVQAYNFRLTLTRDPRARVPFASTPPDGYKKANYEILFRYLEALRDGGFLKPTSTMAEENFLLCNNIGDGLYDVNNRGAVSLDHVGGSWSYPSASYAERSLIWKEHERWIRGLFYAFQHENDPRVTESVRESMRAFGLADNHYLDPFPGDERHWPYQLYVRESQRMVSDFVLHGADIAARDGSEPRSLSTIAAGSYNRDSHHTQRIAVPLPVWHVRNEGNFEVGNGGKDKIFPIPYEVTVPRRAECRNLLVAFCVSATHEAFGAFRMELTLMQVGQSLGMAAAMIAEHPCFLAVQDVPYADLRRRLLETPETTKPYLPQTN
ncbi:FAD-dependent oxidoreductase [Methylobacterium sp. 37f]|uniref:FAD-dependent oxidoreductase n=1 Tax=Methylobacterium sp. 37f TaxID=2817058 RepID=UPI001FFD45A2|nr:FAD-dependent oxidoreductase [Methylobacterium sp. 37f]MCK2053988.1 FAD-dependent oxidoreductase [Methylobacterium sp. 37f]